MSRWWGVSVQEAKQGLEVDHQLALGTRIMKPVEQPVPNDRNLRYRNRGTEEVDSTKARVNLRFHWHPTNFLGTYLEG